MTPEEPKLPEIEMKNSYSPIGPTAHLFWNSMFHGNQNKMTNESSTQQRISSPQQRFNPAVETAPQVLPSNTFNFRMSDDADYIKSSVKTKVMEDPSETLEAFIIIVSTGGPDAKGTLTLTNKHGESREISWNSMMVNQDKTQIRVIPAKPHAGPHSFYLLTNGDARLHSISTQHAIRKL